LSEQPAAIVSCWHTPPQIAAHASIENKDRKRDPEMHQTKKGYVLPPTEKHVLLNYRNSR